MSDFRKEFDLIMKAQFQGKDTLDGVIKSIGGIEDAIKKQAEAAKRGEVSLDQLKSSSTKLVQAQEALKGFGKLFDAFSEAPAKVEAANQALERAKTKLDEYRAGLDSTKTPTQAQADRILKLGEAVDRASVRYDRNRERLVALEAEMQKAGVATDKLSASTDRVRATMTGAVESYQRVKTAIDTYDTAQTRAARGHGIFNDNGRTTLSLMQRIRGEILSVAAAYVGLYGAINGAGKVLEAYRVKQAAINQMSIAHGGDMVKAGQDYDYVRGQAERLGLALDGALKNFSNLSASVGLSGRGKDEARYLFESLSEIGAVTRMTTEQSERATYALTQMLSKGRVYAEEFNQQLGDSIKGLSGVAQEVLKAKFPNFTEAMKEGKVTISDMMTILEAYRAKIGDQLPTALEALQAEQNRFNSSLFDFKLLIAESGFADEFKLLLQDLTKFFQSSDGKEFAQGIADAFKLVAQAIRFAIEHFDEIKVVIEIVATLFAVKLAVGIGAAVGSMVTNFTLLGASLSKVTLSMGTLSAGATGLRLALRSLFALLTSFTVGWEIGTWLNSFDVVQKYMQIFMANMDIFITRAKGNFLEFKAVLSGNFDESRKIHAQMEADIELIRKRRDETTAWYDAGKSGAGTTPKPQAEVTPKPSISEEEQKRKLLDALIAQIDALERNVRQKAPNAMDAIAVAYEQLLSELNAVGGKDADAQVKRLEALHDKQVASVNLYGEKRIAAQTKIAELIAKVEEDAGKKDKETFEARLAAREAEIKRHFETTLALVQKERADVLATGGSTVLIDTQERQLRIATDHLLIVTRKSEATAELKRLEKELNDILDDRNKLIRGEVALGQAGSQTPDQTQANIARIRQEALDKYQALNSEAQSLIENNRDAFSPESLKAFDAALANVLVNLRKANEELISAERAAGMVADGLTPAFEKSASAVYGLINGTKSWGDAIRSVREAFLGFVADFLREIANMIVRQAIFNAMMQEGRNGGSGSGSSYGGLLSTFVTSLMGGGSTGADTSGTMVGNTMTYQAHTGALVGSTGTTRPAISSWFDNAPRYHNGGIAGLASNEYATILKRNEEVLRDSDPRNILNGGSAANQQPANNSVKIMNMIDSASVVSEGLSTQAGERAILNVIRANASGVKMLLGN